MGHRSTFFLPRLRVRAHRVSAQPERTLAARRVRARTGSGEPPAEHARPGGCQQEALLSASADASGPEETQRVTRAAGDFFLESLASFEMVQRGFREATEAARLERRQTEMSRQLSTFLADASLALDASESLEEVLRLVAEQARELVGAECCVATVAMDGQPRAAEAVSFDQTDRRWAGFVRWLDLFAIYRCIRMSGGSVRLAGEQLLEQPHFGSTSGRRSPPQGGLPQRWRPSTAASSAPSNSSTSRTELHRRRRGRPRPSGPDGLGRRSRELDCTTNPDSEWTVGSLREGADQVRLIPTPARAAPRRVFLSHSWRSWRVPCHEYQRGVLASRPPFR